MAGADIALKVANGLAKANAKVGSSSSPKVYLVSIIDTSTATSFGTQTKTYTELVNALFKSFETSSFDKELVNQGDRVLVCSNSVEISIGDAVSIGNGEGQDGYQEFTVVDMKESSPAQVVLSYELHLRAK